jgi:DNA processing protein
MDILLLIQIVCFDRPRLFDVCRGTIQTEADMSKWLASFPDTDPFRRDGLHRFSKRHEVLNAMDRRGIHWMNQNDPMYPNCFSALHDPPMGLFYKGTGNLNPPFCCGVVGTRRPSVMAEHRIAAVMGALQHLTVVSGGALGIDALAHDAALRYGMPTIAVLTGGLDVMTPTSNQGLFQRIIESGLGMVVSECPPGVRPKPYYFPQRNRLIAALSKKLIVVEAAERSGALLTANLALNLGHDIAAMVGAFNSPQSKGCYNLMNDGAAVIGNTADALQFLGAQHQKKIRKKNKKGTLGSELFPSLKLGEHGLPDAVAHFLELVPTAPIHVDDLAGHAKLSVEVAIEYISVLALNEDIMVLPGQMVVRRG